MWTAVGTYGLSVAASDLNGDGWPDILMSNGHVYPEVDRSKADLKYAEHKYLYRNLQNGRFEDVTSQGDRTHRHPRRPMLGKTTATPASADNQRRSSR